MQFGRFASKLPLPVLAKPGIWHVSTGAGGCWIPFLSPILQSGRQHAAGQNAVASGNQVVLTKVRFRVELLSQP